MKVNEKAKRPQTSSKFPVVAIGASAGGLEAMMELLKHLPPDTGMAFIYVQHLSPDHKSLLTEILSNKTRMKVQEIDDMDKIKPDNIFVIPYNKGIEVTDGHIKLIPRSESVAAISIDVLFSSLAEAQKSRVIGIVLSGSASDGTIGIKAIKHEGGLTFAQDDTAKFTSMPHSAIATGAVDYILPPEEIAHELVRLSKHPFLKRRHLKTSKEDLIDNNDPDLKSILNQLFLAKGVDFSAYKRNTIKRRIMRRMLLYKITTLKEYEKLLKQNTEELDILYQDLLINVTSFFRETDTHKYLKLSLLPKLLQRKMDGGHLRIWVPACATGEEAYSIAMMVLEIQSSKSTDIPVKIFATDLSEKAIAKARVGMYTKKDLESVSPRRIQRFFTKSEGNFRINKEVRNLCIFAPHNILSDPPFSRLDFISCCNLFIYFDTAAQKKAISLFHYALKSDGFLMLGKSESISHSAHLFTEFNKKYKIFSPKISSESRKPLALLPANTPSVLPETNDRQPTPNYTKKISVVNQQGLDNAIDEILVAEFMPASVVINHHMEIVQFRGTTDLFLRHPKGKATFNILNMARPEFAFELRKAILQAIRTQQQIHIGGIETKVNAATRIVSIEVVPLEITWEEPLLLIVFTEQEQIEVLKAGKNTSLAYNRRIKSLEDALASAHAETLSNLREHESFTQELQSANEEVVSSNEELQTVNEELETSKEEIESTNEELTSTNQELQIRNDLLNESYEFSAAIVSTMHEPMLVLDKGLRVKSANKAFYDKFKVTQDQTIGMLLYDLGNKQWNIPGLRKLLEDIIPKNAEFYNYEVKHTFLQLGEKIMSLNASRIIQKAHREQLLLLIIADITEVRQLIVEKEIREQEELIRESKIRDEEKQLLEKAVEERTLELKKANEMLEEKNTDLLNMNKELEAFTYVSSHDLQEPVRKIQTFASRILEKENLNLSDSGKNYFRLMQEAAKKMQQLIRDLHAFSLINAADRKFENVKIATIIDAVTADMKDTIDKKQAVVEIKNNCEVKIIPFQFHQLICNLLSNALKFSRPDVPPHIIITNEPVKNNKIHEHLLPDQHYCHIRIKDNGIGFEMEFSNKIFEIFQTLHGNDEYEGTGIGLAIVKKIVENHNGFITVTSKVNKGTAFDIYIPAAQ
ncbi:MAG: PAS domain-containing protein [Saprospiraceae bacterium]|nr:PAS domain-containing protein [Saprospiraceae bacterium]